MIGISPWLAAPLSALLGLGFAAAALRAPSKSRASKQKFNLAIGAFPDAIPILVGIERGFFNAFQIDVHIINWATADSYLSEGKCDGLYGPKYFMKVGVDNPQGANIEVGATLAFYLGYGIIIHPSAQDVKTYSDFCHEGLNNNLAAQKALAQLQGRLTQCMSIDALAATIRVSEHFGGSFTKSEFRLTEEPNKNFKNFVNATDLSKGSTFFVGGVTQRLIARKLGMRVLIEDADLPFSVCEHIAFITRALNSDGRASLEAAWFNTMRHMHRDRSFQERMIELMNKYIAPLYEGISFDQVDLNQILYHLEHFPEREEDATRLAEVLNDSVARFEREISEVQSRQQRDRVALAG